MEGEQLIASMMAADGSEDLPASFRKRTLSEAATNNRDKGSGAIRVAVNSLLTKVKYQLHCLCFCFCLSVCQSVCLPVCLFVSVSACLPVRPSVCLSVCLSIIWGLVIHVSATSKGIEVLGFPAGIYPTNLLSEG